MERIDKILSHQLQISRKDVKSLVAKKQVKIGDRLVKKSDEKVDTDKDEVFVSGKKLQVKMNLYLMLNKPKGYVSATEDKKQKTVLDLVPNNLKRKDLFPAGRLDKDTTGFVLITDDGQFAHDILSPKKHVTKEYIAIVDGMITDEIVEGFKNGINFKSGETCKSSKLIVTQKGDTQSITRVFLKEGMYHQIKRMFKSYGLNVLELKRIRMGGLYLDESLEEGEVRELTSAELEKIKEKTQEDDF